MHLLGECQLKIRKFKIVRPYFDLPFAASYAIKKSFSIEPLPTISEYINKNIYLIEGAYTNTGKVTLYKWEKDPIDAVLDYPLVIYLGPTQTAKSFMADMCVYYGMDIMSIEGMVIYNNEKTVKKVFKRRIKPMIEKNDCLRKLWSGKEDDLSIENIQLKHCFWGIASVGNRNDIATFPAGMIIWSEVSKAEIPRDKSKRYDIMSEIKGRQEAYSPYRRKIILESTPNIKGDYMYQEVYKPGVMILQPHLPCPHCGGYQVMVDSQIKLRKKGKEEPDHDPVRIRQEKEKAVWYECIYCHQEIEEKNRSGMGEKVIWAAPKIEERISDRYTFSQDAERIRKNGKIEYNREKMLVPCYQWNRLINPDFFFWECLARFFEAKRTPDKMHIYLNNDMAKFYTPKSERMATNILEQRIIQSNYFAFGDKAFIPSDVLLLLCALDTQDDGFFYVVQGFGQNMMSWINRFGFIECSIEDDENQEYEKSYNKVLNGLFEQPYRMKINNEIKNLNFARGFIDRGGHRAELVDYICDRLFNFDPYIGANRDDPAKEMIYDSGKGYYIGKTELISDLVGAHLKMKSCKFPFDTTKEFINQITNQYHYDEMDRNGNVKRRWKHGGNDHYRDCLNMIYAAVLEMGLDVGLFDANVCEKLRQQISKKTIVSKQSIGIESKVENIQEQRYDVKEKKASQRRRSMSYFGAGRW